MIFIHRESRNVQYLFLVFYGLMVLAALASFALKL